MIILRTVISEIIIAFFAVYGFYSVTDEIKKILRRIANKNIDNRRKKSDNIIIGNNNEKKNY